MILEIKSNIIANKTVDGNLYINDASLRSIPNKIKSPSPPAPINAASVAGSSIILIP